MVLARSVRMQPPAYLQSSHEVLIALQSQATGLSVDEAARRLLRDGPNVLAAPPQIRAWRVFAAQFQSIIIWILIGAGVLSAVLHETTDASAIAGIVLLNAAIGFYQEWRSARSIAALQQLASPRATVLRAGVTTSVATTSLVTGDIIVLEAGDLIAADARMLASSALASNESALTGESESVLKEQSALSGTDLPLGDRSNMVFMGTSVVAGSGHAIVVATAKDTEVGRIAALISEATIAADTPLQTQLNAFGRVLVWIAVGIVLVLFALGMLRGIPLLELTMTAVSLAVAAVPEGLPAIVTVALSLGALRMARQHALVRKLAAVETLGATSVICTDKTGTLTVGQMTVRVLYVASQSYDVAGDGYEPTGSVVIRGRAESAPLTDATSPLRQMATVLMAYTHANVTQQKGQWRAIGDSTEAAQLVAAMKLGANRAEVERDMPIVLELPFDSDRKRGTVIRRTPHETLRAFVNGAPGGVLAACTHIHETNGRRALTEADRTRILAQTSRMAQSALRVLASAYRDLPRSAVHGADIVAVERDLTFMGLSGMYDPPRAEAAAAIDACRRAGIRVVMITGDHPQTAAAIARELHIAPPETVALAGSTLNSMSDDELQLRVRSTTVFARVSAEHKLRIVRALQAQGDVVAMIGDGVNDAPALKGADVGVAMGRSGTEVSRQAANLILTDDNFATILRAVAEGRGIYNNIRKTLQYLLAGNTGELLLMTMCVVLGMPSPLLPIHLLWINLVTDGLPAFCLATDAISETVMQRPPRPRTARLTDGGFLRTMLWTGGLTGSVAFGTFWFLQRTETVVIARGAAFDVLVFAELLRAFGARSETVPVWRMTPMVNRNLLVVVCASFVIQRWSQHPGPLANMLKTPQMSLGMCAMLLLVGTIPLAVLELRKLVRQSARATSASRGHTAG